MNRMLELLGAPMMHQIGWVLLHSLWQGLVVGAVYWMLRFALRRKPAAQTYTLGCLALGLMVALPVFTVASHSRNAATATGSGISNATSSLGGGSPKMTSTTWSGVPTPGGANFYDSGGAFLENVAPILTPMWLLGVAFFTVKLTRGYASVRKLYSSGAGSVEGPLLDSLERLRHLLGVSRPVGLVKSSMIHVPAVVGCFRPLILLPAATMTGMSPEQLEAILAHELAHVRRWDYFINGCQCVVEALMFYHPFVWWISRKIREDREICCDDLAVAACGDRIGYARALASLEESRANLPDMAFAASGGSLLTRIRRLLGLARDDGPATVRQISGLAVMGMGLVFILLGIYLLNGPALYRATARVNFAGSGPRSTGGDVTSPGTRNPAYAQAEIGRMRSPAVLDQVVTRCNLARKWGSKRGVGESLPANEVMAMLQSRLEFRPVADTTLVDIRAVSEEPAEAAVIASAVAETYQSYRMEEGEAAVSKGLDRIRELLKQQESQISEGARDMDRLRQEFKIPAALANESNAQPLITAETLRRVEANELNTRFESARQETLLERLKACTPEQLVSVLPTAVQDTSLNSLMDSLTASEQRLLVARKDFVTNRYEIEKAQSLVESLTVKMRARAEAIVQGLELKVSAMKQSSERVAQEITQLQERDARETRRTQPYYDAKKKLQDLTHAHEILRNKLLVEEINLHASPSIEIVENASTPTRAFSPNRPRSAAMIGFGMLLELIGIGMLRPGRRVATVSPSGQAVIQSQP